MLAVAGGKGGVGKTTTALGLALDLAVRGRRTLAVDADRHMPDLHVRAGVPPRPTVAALVGDAPTDGPDAAERSLAGVARPIPGRPRAAVLPAAPGVERASMRRALRRLGSADPAVVVDLPAGAGPDVADPLRLADGCVVVTRPTPPGLRDAAKTAALARALDTPVVGGLVVGETDATRVAELLSAPVEAVPAVEAPLGDERVTRGRRTLLARTPPETVSRVDSTVEPADRPPSAR